MIPIHDDNPTRTVPFVTWTFIVANVLVFFYELSLPPGRPQAAFFADFALVPADVVHAQRLTDYGTVVTSMFLHGGWMHLIGNMLYFWIFGNNIEDSVGHFKFVLFYLLCGAAAAATQVAISPDSTVPMIGASGAISGVLGAYMLLFPRAPVTILVPIVIFIRIIQVPAWVMLLFWFALQLVSGSLQLGVRLTGGVAFWAHVGGFVAGLALIPLFKKRRVRLFQ